MTYQEAVTYIHSALKFGIKPGLERISRLLELMGSPQDRVKTVHVAGTNAKGSVAAMTASGLRRAGFKTGLYISPYIERFNERISINGDDIGDGELALEVESILPHIEQLKGEGYDEPTEFELITAVAFSYFWRMGCDYCVIETGLGGRLDATNVLKSPELCVITALSMDHTDILGDTMEKIAFEKCGILKRGVKAVIYPEQPAAAMDVIEKRAREEKAALTVPDLSLLENVEPTLGGTYFSYRGKRLKTTLIGPHQAKNALTAIEALFSLGVSMENIEKGLSQTVFPGRFEVLGREPLAIIDGGHNAAGIDALCLTLDALLPDRPIVAVMGMLKDKEYPYCIEKIASRARRFIAVAPDNPRALTAKECMEQARKSGVFAETACSPEEGFLRALELSSGDDVVLACGSLYFIGALRGFYRQKFKENRNST